MHISLQDVGALVGRWKISKILKLLSSDDSSSGTSVPMNHKLHQRWWLVTDGIWCSVLFYWSDSSWNSNFKNVAKLQDVDVLFRSDSHAYISHLKVVGILYNCCFSPALGKRYLYGDDGAGGGIFQPSASFWPLLRLKLLASLCKARWVSEDHAKEMSEGFE